MLDNIDKNNGGNMRKALIALLVASAVAFTVVCIPLATITKASSCEDVYFIFARGSGEKLNDEEFSSFKSNIIKKIKLTLPELKYNFYELGSDYQNGYKYPAVDLDFFSAISTTLSKGTAFEFGKSIDEGINELKSYIAKKSSACPTSKFVLGGYSQGAMVITKALPYLNPANILYVANFGDPKLYLPEGEGLFPDACRGENLSPYREYAPNCRTSAGYLGAKKPYLESGWNNKVGLWCNDGDFICGGGFILSEPFRTHVRYADDGRIYDAAKIISEKLIDKYPNYLKTSEEEALSVIQSSGNRDVVFLLDTTGSMDDKLLDATSSINWIAQQIVENGGRVGLWIFGDLEEIQPSKIVDFTNNLEEFYQKFDLDTLPKSDGGDFPESVYSAALAVLNGMEWKSGATKSVILITDDEPLDPDRDGTTLEDVARRSLEIDPVNFYTLGMTNDLKLFYENFINATDGKQINLTSDNSNYSSIINRPNISLALAEYIAQPNSSLTFEIKGELSGIEHVDWDLDLDGEYDTTTNEPYISAKYSHALDGYLKAKVKYKNGEHSTASSKVTITDSPVPTPSLSVNNILYGEDDISVSYSFENAATGALISIDEIPVGYSTIPSIDFNYDLVNSTILLIPFSSSGLLGTPVKITLQNNTDKTGKTEYHNNDSDTNASDYEDKLIDFQNLLNEKLYLRAPNSGRK